MRTITAEVPTYDLFMRFVGRIDNRNRINEEIRTLNSHSTRILRNGIH